MADDDKKIEAKLVRLANQISGGRVSPEEAQEMLARAKENVRLLEGCEGPHDFRPVRDEGSTRQMFRCSKCQGVVNSQAVVWYRKGVAHGKEHMTRNN